MMRYSLREGVSLFCAFQGKTAKRKLASIVYLFEDTIYNNISMGRPDASYEDVMEAARKARCYELITNLPYGFDTIVGEGGASLSGGEAQRISIARCILKDAPVILLVVGVVFYRVLKSE